MSGGPVFQNPKFRLFMENANVCINYDRIDLKIKMTKKKADPFTKDEKLITTMKNKF